MIEDRLNCITLGGIMSRNREELDKLTEFRKKCPHDKIYSNSILCSNPPQREWVCRICGKRDTDSLSLRTKAKESYELVRERFSNVLTMDDLNKIMEQDEEKVPKIFGSKHTLEDSIPMIKKEWDVWICGHCGKAGIFPGMNHCYHCGSTQRWDQAEKTKGNK